MKADSSPSARPNSGAAKRLEPKAAVAAPDAAVDSEPAAVVTAEGTAVPSAEADTCGSCRYFQPRKVYRAAEPLGVCRWLPGGTPMAASGWCGQFKEKVDVSG